MLFKHLIKYHQNLEHQDILSMKVEKSNSLWPSFT